MGQQVGGHEGPVAVSAHEDAVGVGHAKVDEFTHGGLGVHADLLDEGFVGLIVTLSDDGHSEVVKYGVARRQEGQGGERTDPAKLVVTGGHLTGLIGILILLGVGPHQGREGSVLARAEALGGVQLAAELYAVRAAVGHQLVPGVLKLGVGVGEVGNAPLLAGQEVVQEEVRTFVRLLAGQQEVVRVLIQKEKGPLEVGGRRGPLPRLLVGAQVKGVDEGARPGGAVSVAHHDERLAPVARQ